MHYRKITLSSLFASALLALIAAPAQADDAGFSYFAEKGSSAAPAPEASFQHIMLAAHNAERSRRRVPPLVWDRGLASDAAAHARRLAGLGYLQHASMAGRAQPQGENLWMGTRGMFSYAEMMDGFLGERSDYVAGPLPDISRTGNWTDTGHYSQIIWRTTTAVGCAIASSKDFDFLVCRYDPAGNIWGKRADDADRRAPSLAMSGY